MNSRHILYCIGVKPLIHQSEFRTNTKVGMRSIIPTAHNSDSPLLRQPITPTAHYSDGPFFRQCKIELNPQIHGLTRCIQQDVPSVRLILTDHGLDRMFWKGKGAFILGCTSPFKAIMIDRPGMGKVKN